MQSFTTLILAAGKGTRMKSDLAKVLNEMAGKPLVHHVIKAAKESGSEKIVLIIGHQADRVKESTAEFGVFYALQEEQLGTGHAVMQAKNFVDEEENDVLVLLGDVPLITVETLQNLYEVHKNTDASATILTAVLEDSTGYGRIIRNSGSSVEKIVEQKDASEAELEVKEINSGIFFFKAKDLSEALGMLTSENAQNEYYLTDTVEIFKKANKVVSAYIVKDINETHGINTVEQLKNVEQIFLARG
ncbi:MAG: UDP-N-acetylglucosamine pyrophosphorylase [Calditrichaeota bacterium]|nr:MAG: UDP-N-acetylglucosamine pyrophosphorylase [Calditrichota bacterium]